MWLAIYMGGKREEINMCVGKRKEGESGNTESISQTTHTLAVVGLAVVGSTVTGVDTGASVSTGNVD